MLEKQRLDRSAVGFTDLDHIGDEREYWRTKSPDERLEAAELIRQSVYGYDPANARMDRSIVKIIDCSWG